MLLKTNQILGTYILIHWDKNVINCKYGKNWENIFFGFILYIHYMIICSSHLFLDISRFWDFNLRLLNVEDMGNC